MPKISVNIPCFNSAKFIKETIESVLNQTINDFEIIIMDDGSTDNTSEIVSSFKDPRIRYFYKANEGLSETRNKAIRLSNGEYIAFIDHDDLWLPHKLEKQLNILEKNRNLGLVFSDSYILRDSKKERLTYFDRCMPKRGFIFEELLFANSNFIPLLTVVMPKNIFERIGFFKTDLKLGEDLDLFLRVAEQYECDYIQEPLAIYRIHKTNFSKNKEILLEEVFTILELWQNKNPDLFIRNEDKFLKKQADILADVAHFYALDSRKKDALANFNLSLKKHRDNITVIKKYILLFFGCFGYRLFNNMRNALFII